MDSMVPLPGEEAQGAAHMHPTRSSWTAADFVRVLLAGVLLTTAAGAVRADLLIFKDGFVIPGKVMREKKTLVDPYSGEVVELSEGFFMIDSGARRIVFSPGQLKEAVEDKDAVALMEITSSAYMDQFNARPVPPIREVLDAGTFDKDWNRLFK